MQTKSARTWGTLIYAVGLIFALGLALAAIWGDYEALSYFYTGAVYGPFGGLHCPALMTHAEVVPISATFDNPTDKTIEPFYQVKISGVAALRTIEKQLQVPPHSSATIQWTVDANDIDVGSFVMTKLTVLPFAGNPAREATCGMLVLNLGNLTSAEVLPVGLGIGLVGIVLGLTLREGNAQPDSPQEASLRNGMRATGVAVLLALLTGFLGAWILGLIFSAITILMAFILFRIGSS